MTPLVARLTGNPVPAHLEESDIVPVPATRMQRSRRSREVQRRHSAAAMILGLGEDEEGESIIPDDAEEIENIAGPSGIRLDNEKTRKDQEPDEPDTPSEIYSDEEDDRLLTPRDALVAPDVTPQALDPIDASEVPKAPEPPRFVQPEQSKVDPMSILLGRSSAPQSSGQQMPPEQVVTAESTQATVNAILNPGGVSGEALMRPKTPMPDHKPADGNKIMEAFERYGPARSWPKHF